MLFLNPTSSLLAMFISQTLSLIFLFISLYLSLSVSCSLLYPLSLPLSPSPPLFLLPFSFLSGHSYFKEKIKYTYVPLVFSNVVPKIKPNTELKILGKIPELVP